ncbi:MAG: indole-3-glycerol phosphate synthase TrpC [Firmicutes bacterium]|nr:indole-3-glycerol phosphate synthase TrpC [Bacillota bacterium]
MILDQIAADRRADLALRKALVPPATLERLLLTDPGFSRPPLDFAGALRRAPGMAVIAEVKRASPSAGEIRGGLDAAEAARGYQEAGAAAVSVLTEPRYFRGSLADVARARASCRLPLLRKDFVLDEYQLLEARLAGADAVLLIVALLRGERLRTLLAGCRGLGLAALVEVHTAEELDQAIEAGADLVGINNRDLGTFQVDLGTTLALAPRVPPGILLVSESGIRSPEDVRFLAAGGVRAVLVGETLVRAENPAAVLRSLSLAGVKQSDDRG